MSMQLPEGSKIGIDRSNVHETIIIPHGSGGIMRFFVGLFLLFWLGGWFIGFKETAALVLAGKANGFVMFWLAGWTVAGIGVVCFLFRVFRPPVAESLALLAGSVQYDSGVPPFQMQFGFSNQKEAWRSMFTKRTRIEIGREQIKTLNLRETDSGNRLTVDVGAQRLDIAVGATEVEREWLFDLLREKYG